MLFSKLAALLLCLGLTFFAFSQKQKTRPLNVGDNVPDIRFNNVLNFRAKTISLSQFKGKLVILDMWSVSCATCIARFPKMDALQKEFNGKIQILLVNPHPANYDSKERIETTLKKLKDRTGFYPSLPIPIHDSILNIYFPHQSVPHVIWIDAQGRVAGITEGKEVNRENISAILNGQIVNLPIKNDRAFDISRPLLFEGNGGNGDDFIYRSLITEYKDGMGVRQGNRTNDTGKVVGVYMINRTLFSLIQEAYSNLMNSIPLQRMVLDVTDQNKFAQDGHQSNQYCYDLVLPPVDPQTFHEKKYLQKYLQQDLNRYFNIMVYKTTRMMNALIIKSTRKVTDHFSNSKKEVDLDKTSIKKFIHNYTVDKVLNTLLSGQVLPYVDETGISDQKIDVDFPDNFDLSNQQAVIDFLKSIGFDIKEEERELDVVVITDK